MNRVGTLKVGRHVSVFTGAEVNARHVHRQCEEYGGLPTAQQVLGLEKHPQHQRLGLPGQ